MKTIIFDIDGTLADNSHRLHHIQKEPKDWDAFFEAMDEDKPIKNTVSLYEIIKSAFDDLDACSPQREVVFL